MGQQTSVTKPSGHVMEYAYTKRNRVTRVTNPDVSDANTTYAYDGVGNLVAVKAPLGAITGNTYDPLSRLLRVNDALDQNTTYAYDQAGNLLSTTDPNNHVVEYEYGVMNRLVEKQDALDRNTTYAYDVGGRLTRTGFANGNAVDYTYDERGNLIKLRTDDGNYTYRYDANGNRIGAKSVPASGGIGFADENLTYTYDKVSRLEYKRYRVLGVDLKYEYDGNGRRTQLEYGDSLQYDQNYSYDGLNRLNTLMDPDGLATTFEYSCCDLLENVKMGTDLNITYGYDAGDRLTRISHRHHTSRLPEFLYTLNNKNEITERVYKEDSEKSETTDYTYDALGRVTETYTSSTDWFDYGYDGYSNLATVHKYGSANDYNLLFDSADECTDLEHNSFTATESYDAAGNLVLYHTPIVPPGAGDYCLVYDSLNRLARGNWEGGSAYEVFQSYDAEGNSSAYATTANADANVLYHIYDGADLLAVYKLANDTPFMRFVHGPGIDNPLKMTARTGHKFYYHKDLQHSVYGLSNEDGVVKETYAYDPYGKCSRSWLTTEAGQNPFRYTGRETFDANPTFGIYNYRSRHYLPTLGRFTTMDSFSGFLSRPASLNKYMYVEGGPINATDPWGYWAGRLPEGNSDDCVRTSLVYGVLGGIVGYLTGGTYGAGVGFLGGFDSGMYGNKDCWDYINNEIMKFFAGESKKWYFPPNPRQTDGETYNI